MTPAQLDDAVQALQLNGCHDNSIISQSEDNVLTTESVREEDDETVRTVVDEAQQQEEEDVTPPGDDTIADNDDDGAQSDSSEQSGLCIDYHSDSATEGIYVMLLQNPQTTFHKYIFGASNINYIHCTTVPCDVMAYLWMCVIVRNNQLLFSYTFKSLS